MIKLTDPVSFKNIALKNRLVMPPMATGKSDDGAVSQQLLDYYDEKTKGGYIGLVVIEHEYVSLEGKASENQISVSSDEDIAGLKKLADLIHANGSKVILQINHAGGKACADQPKAPSGIEYVRRVGGEVTALEMTAEDIQNVISDFTNAARRAKVAGFDGVEIHAAHGYLLSQFYSPLTNKRTDDYSGSTLSGRTRLHTEIIRSVRKEVGDDYFVAIRFGAVEDIESGVTAEDAPSAAKLFEEAGADLIDISGGNGGYIRPLIRTPGYFIKETDAIARAVNIPVLTAGGITSRSEADALLNEYKVDLIGVARAILQDSSWAEKAIEEN